jgi:hypothetical protein
VALATSLVLASVWAVALPQVPDLSAQLARAELAATAGLVPFWTSWYAGLPTLGYSVFVPLMVANLGPQVIGVVLAAVTAVAGAMLLRDSRRPRSGALLLAVLGVLDVSLGRLTFAVGVAVGLAGVAFATRGRSRSSALVSALCGLTSPLAGAFLSLAHLSAGVAGTAPLARRRWAGLLVATVAPIAVVELMFPQAGFEWAEPRWGTLTTARGSMRVPSEQGAYQQFYSQFAAALRGNAEFPVPAGQAIHALEVLDAARLSSVEGRVVSVADDRTV